MKSRMQSMLNLPAIAVAGMLTTGAATAEETNRIMNIGCESYQPIPVNPYRDNIIYKVSELLDFSGDSNANVSIFLQQLQCGNNKEIHLNGSQISITDINGNEYNFDATAGEREQILELGTKNNIEISQDQSNIIYFAIEVVSKLAVAAILLYSMFKIPITIAKYFITILAGLLRLIPTEKNRQKKIENANHEAEKTRELIEKNKLFAFHEAGHAVLFLLLNRKIISADIKGILAENIGGMVIPSQENPTLFIQNVVEMMLSMYGGRIGVFLEYGISKIDTGAYTDIRVATNYAESLCCDYGISDIGFLKELFGIDGGGKLGDDENIIVSSFRSYNDESRENIPDHVDEQINNILREGATWVLELLKKHKELLDIISIALQEKKELSGDQLEAIFQQYKDQSPHLFVEDIQAEFDFGMN